MKHNAFDLFTLLIPTLPLLTPCLQIPIIPLKSSFRFLPQPNRPPRETLTHSPRQNTRELLFLNEGRATCCFGTRFKAKTVVAVEDSEEGATPLEASLRVFLRQMLVLEYGGGSLGSDRS